MGGLHGRAALAPAGDVWDVAPVQCAVDPIAVRFGRLDTLVDSASSVRAPSSFKMPDDGCDAMIAVHVRGALAGRPIENPHEKG
jgi:NAD(P)-dependent dehydrogenase (short-subunit alcohol dehydrogenase family)